MKLNQRGIRSVSREKGQKRPTTGRYHAQKGINDRYEAKCSIKNFNVVKFRIHKVKREERCSNLMV